MLNISETFKGKILLVSNLYEFIEQIATHEVQQFFVKEFYYGTYNNLSLISKSEGEEVLSECVLGGISGIKNGNVYSQTLLLKHQGAVELEFNEGLVFNLQTFEHDIVYGQYFFIFDQMAQSIIFTITAKVNKMFENVMIEWTVENNRPVIIDFSLPEYAQDNKILRKSNNQHKTVSLGKIQGCAYVLSDERIDQFLGLSSGFAVSVKGETTNVEAVPEIKKILNELDAFPTDVIIVTERPLTILKAFAFHPKVNGFIFKKASLLCHLAIVLREGHIPAIVSDNFDNIKHGEFYSIEGS